MSDHDTWNMFAAAALGGLAKDIRDDITTHRTVSIVNASCDLADALLAESKKRETPAPTPPQPDDDGWIKHHGGPMPVSGETKVMFRFKNGEEDGPSPAHEADWGPGWGDYTITAYRIASEAGVTK